MTREPLPNRRASETFNLEVYGLRYTCTVSRFSDGRIAEIFLSTTAAAPTPTPRHGTAPSSSRWPYSTARRSTSSAAR
ncbi:MAG TPA: hypothetical protein VF913_18800 [Xanthobacteraceae bacterium]